MKLEDVLDDLCARFIINLPEEERSSFERLGFQVEQAFWFYDDFYRPSQPQLPKLNLRSFGKILLQRYPPLIAPFGRNFDKLYDEFMAYKHAIPVCGAIILNDSLSKCILVKGWSSKASWGFPKGKIGKDEDPADCAVREVFEETGYDISPLISSNNFIDAHTANSSSNSTNQQSTRLFIIPGVPESTVFTPQTRKEISKIQWHSIESLPTKYGQDNSFYNVVNFVKTLKHWIKTVGQDYKKNPKNKSSKNNNNNKNKRADNSVIKKKGSVSSRTSSKDSSPLKQQQVQDIFDKLRSKNDHSPVNSLLMRDNPSPIHLFEKLSEKKAEETENLLKQTEEISCKDRLLNAIEKFAIGLKSLKINRSVIREAINKA